jgi:hypothetical protein
LLEIGAGERFSWLWRSRLLHYDRHARAWHKWLGRTLLFWNRLRHDRAHEWRAVSLFTTGSKRTTSMRSTSSKAR